MSTELFLPKAPDALLRVAVAGLLCAGVTAAAGHALLGWDPGAWQAWLPGCLVRAATGFPCPGCGMTRALLLLLQLRLEAALTAHPAAPVVVAAVLVWGIRPPRWSPRLRDGLCGVALVALLGVWIARWLTPAPGLPL